MHQPALRKHASTLIELPQYDIQPLKLCHGMKDLKTSQGNSAFNHELPHTNLSRIPFNPVSHPSQNPFLGQRHSVCSNMVSSD
jgi:hypothetical protein